MGFTRETGRGIADDSILRVNLNTTTPASAVITKNVAGNAVALKSTGVDAGTGDVTITANAGFSNKIINGNFCINQRAYASGTSLSAGAYAHDQWKAGASGCTYTFTQSDPATTITITAGSLIQVIEGSELEGGNFVLSWSGSATCKVNGATAAASPIALSGLTAGANVTLEFGTGVDIGFVQFNQGTSPQPWISRPKSIEMALCRRYCRRFIAASTGPMQLLGTATAASQPIGITMLFDPPMYTAPTLTVIGTWGTSNGGQPQIIADAGQALLYTLSIAAGFVQVYAAPGDGFMLEAKL